MNGILISTPRPTMQHVRYFIPFGSIYVDTRSFGMLWVRSTNVVALVGRRKKPSRSPESRAKNRGTFCARGDCMGCGDDEDLVEMNAPASSRHSVKAEAMSVDQSMDASSENDASPHQLVHRQGRLTVNILRYIYLSGYYLLYTYSYRV